MSFINTQLELGASEAQHFVNRFNGFWDCEFMAALQTVETVEEVWPCS
jgi:hypothetical protein